MRRARTVCGLTVWDVDPDIDPRMRLTAPQPVEATFAIRKTHPAGVPGIGGMPFSRKPLTLPGKPLPRYRSYDSRRADADCLIRYVPGLAQNFSRSSLRLAAPP